MTKPNKITADRDFLVRQVQRLLDELEAARFARDHYLSLLMFVLK